MNVAHKFHMDVKNLESTSLRLRTYTGELVRPVGVGQVDVVYEG